MNNESIYRLRERDLRAAYNKLASVHGVNFRYLKVGTIISMLLEEEAPRFYVSPEWAYEIVRRYKKSGKWSCRNIDMMEDLMKQYERLRRQYPKLSVCKLFEMAVASPAKSFYISPHRIREILFNYTGRYTSKRPCR